MDPRTGLHDVKRRKILPPPGLELRPLGRRIATALSRLSRTVGKYVSYVVRQWLQLH
jgi:hypothetical protein